MFLSFGTGLGYREWKTGVADQRECLRYLKSRVYWRYTSAQVLSTYSKERAAGKLEFVSKTTSFFLPEDLNRCSL